VRLVAGDDPARVLLIAARPLGEPVAHWGPFVMNTRDEIDQAIADYRAGRLVD
jgi:redox-sensitive bicupin YhaK (pirin superfamily)